MNAFYAWGFALGMILLAVILYLAICHWFAVSVAAIGICVATGMGITTVNFFRACGEIGKRDYREYQ